jgi:hypothetical protein
VLRAHAGALAAGLLLALPPLWWLASHYLQAARAYGLYSYEAVALALPNPALWWSRGECWLSVTRGLVALGVLPGDPWPGGECALGIGPVTTVLVVFGLWRARRLRQVRLLALGALTLLLLFTVFWFPAEPGGPGKTLYALVFPLLPAAGAVRAPGRVILVLLIPAALGLAYALQDCGRRSAACGVKRAECRLRSVGGVFHSALRTPPSAILLALLCLLEQGRSAPTFDKYESRARIAQVVERLRPDCTAFFVSRTVTAPFWPDCATQLDAMWAALATGLPTVNGYSGGQPPGWDLGDNQQQAGLARAPLARELTGWLAQHGVPRSAVRWIRLGSAQ